MLVVLCKLFWTWDITSQSRWIVTTGNRSLLSRDRKLSKIFISESFFYNFNKASCSINYNSSFLNQLLHSGAVNTKPNFLIFEYISNSGLQCSDPCWMLTDVSLFHLKSLYFFSVISSLTSQRMLPDRDSPPAQCCLSERSGGVSCLYQTPHIPIILLLLSFPNSISN